MRAYRFLGAFAAVAALIAVASAKPAEAQSAADQFVGKWTIAFEAPTGGFGGGGGGGFGGGGGGGGGGGMGGPGGGGGGMRGPTVLDITTDAGKLVASLTGGPGAMGQPIAITDVAEVEGGLLLTYSVTMQGQARPITLRLTRDGTTVRVVQDIGGMFQRNGTATKE